MPAQGHEGGAGIGQWAGHVRRGRRASPDPGRHGGARECDQCLPLTPGHGALRSAPSEKVPNAAAM